jgi:DNA-3-methyladenine glycosylase
VPPPVLSASFYDRPVLAVARDLVGCTVTHGATSGVIVETEAYHMDEPAAHSFRGPTPSNEMLFGPPGLAYVYRSYGIHAMLNAVVERDGIGSAVLIRALEPATGIDVMRARRGVAGRGPLTALCSGPGKLAQALGIGLDLNGTSLVDGPIAFGPRPPAWRDPAIVVGVRIGITKAVDLPWRFCAAGNPHVSRPRP